MENPGRKERDDDPLCRALWRRGGESGGGKASSHINLTLLKPVFTIGGGKGVYSI
jgi:hypothetical protein